MRPATSPPPRLHAGAWLVWAVAAAASVELATSPLYVALVVGVAFVVVSVHGEDTPLARAFPLLLSVGLAFALVRVVLTAATTHTGADALFTTPSVTLPRLLGGFEVGGPVELGVVLQSAAEGFAIVGVMAVFGAFNAVVSHHELVQSAPRAFYEPGLILTVSIAFVPATVATVARVREADRARTGGRVVRRGRLLRLVVPVMETALERALLLAESMDARGFASAGATRADRTAGWCVLAALAGLGGAFVALVGRARGVAVALGASGVAAVAVAVAVASRRSARPRYRARRMGRRDWVVAAVSLVAPLGLAALALSGDGTLRWAASPLAVPEFNVVAALALGALTAPAWRGGTGRAGGRVTPALGDRDTAAASGPGPAVPAEPGGASTSVRVARGRAAR